MNFGLWRFCEKQAPKFQHCLNYCRTVCVGPIARIVLVIRGSVISKTSS
ncbi:hypothetical protein RR48_08490 [Papilio machaon]|uniref:Uncharacterized protein n=1 Tax=Papilio machaon TaxID=76193 RepID=A0A194QPP5_PAPMA|nr:hypothetical protein RR48_08490 [Papilio machaon]